MAQHHCRRRTPNFVSFPRSGILPPALLNPSSPIIDHAFDAVGTIETGIRMGDASIIRAGQREISRSVSAIKRELCSAFHYLEPDPANPQVWQVLCTSGAGGEFLADPDACAECVLFNLDTMPTPLCWVKSGGIGRKVPIFDIPTAPTKEAAK